MRIGILTGGGDVPGLNSCIKAVVNRAEAAGHQVIGIRRGWRGLLFLDPEDPSSLAACTLKLDNSVVRTIDRTGVTFLHTSRTNPSKVRAEDLPPLLQDARRQGVGNSPFLDCTARVLRNLETLKLDVLIPIGGDDTLGYGERLHREGFPVVAIPKTMDNDVFGTDCCIGFSTAVTRSVNFLHQLRTSAGSHERIAVVELFGRNSGETSLISSYLAGTDRALIPEVPFRPDRLADLVMGDKRNNPSNYAMVSISEGAQMVGEDLVESGQADAYGHRKLGGIGAATGRALKRITGQNIIYQQLSYLMRSGSPDSLDLMVSLNFANMAMSLVMNRQFGRLTAMRDGRYTNVPLGRIREALKRVDVDELYDRDHYRPKVRHVDGKPGPSHAKKRQFSGRAGFFMLGLVLLRHGKVRLHSAPLGQGRDPAAGAPR